MIEEQKRKWAAIGSDLLALYFGTLMFGFLLSQTIGIIKGPYSVGYKTTSLYIWVLFPGALCAALLAGSRELALMRGAQFRTGLKRICLIAFILIAVHLCINVGGVWYANNVIGSKNLLSPMDDIPIGGIVTFGPNVSHSAEVSLAIFKKEFFFFPGPLLMALTTVLLRNTLWLRV